MIDRGSNSHMRLHPKGLRNREVTYIHKWCGNDALFNDECVKPYGKGKPHMTCALLNLLPTKTKHGLSYCLSCSAIPKTNINHDAKRILERVPRILCSRR